MQGCLVRWRGHRPKRLSGDADAPVCIIGLALSVLLAYRAHPAFAACNLIPQTTKTFDSVLGSTNRPFAAPGEPIALHIRPCDTASPGFTPNGSDNVSIIFTPPGSATPHVVVLTAAADCSALSSQLSACGTLVGAANVSCLGSTDGAVVQLVTRADGPHLQFQLPNTHAQLGTTNVAETLSGPATIAVSAQAAPLPCQLATTSCAGQSGLIACIDDFFANDGACGRGTPQGTFNHFTALPIANDFAADCFDSIPPCNPLGTEFRLTADKDGNVLVPINWQAVLVRQADTPVPRLLRAVLAPQLPSPFPPISIQLPGPSFVASFTPEGGPLAPIFVPQFDPTAPSGVLNLFGSADAPYTILRLARRSAVFQQCTGGANDQLPCNGPDDCPGVCAGGHNLGLHCMTDTDCPNSTCDSRGTCGQTVCAGGLKSQQPCSGDANCPGGECGPSAFTDVRGLGVGGGAGPLVIPQTPPTNAPGVCQVTTTSLSCTVNSDCSTACSADPSCSAPQCVQYALTAENPVPLQSLTAQSQNVFALTSDETIDQVDRNGDGDHVDAVATLRDRQTGTIQPLGAPTECGLVNPQSQGRAVVQLHQGPYVFPAVATENNVVAFLESEPAEGNCDENSNGATFDAVFRAFRLGDGELTAGTHHAADAALLINNQSLVISNGRAFFRESEAATANKVTTRVSVDSGGTQVTDLGVTNFALSGDGRFVAFGSGSAQLVPGDSNGADDIFVRDRVLNTTERVSVDSAGTEGNGFSDIAPPVISADGRYVAFASVATSLVPGDTNGKIDIFVRDRIATTTTRVSVNSSGDEANDDSAPFGGFFASNLAMSADGRYVVFPSKATNLDNTVLDTNGFIDVFLRDRVAGTTSCMSLAADGLTQGNGDSGGTTAPGPSFLGVAISADGRYVAFASYADNLLGPGVDTNGKPDVFVRDRCLTNGNPVSGCTPSLRRVSIASNGQQGTGGAIGFAVAPSFSADGRYLSFVSDFTNLVPGASGTVFQTYVHDRVTAVTTRESVGLDGTEANGNSGGISALSADGRYLVFCAEASNLIPSDTNGATDIFLRDRVAGTTTRLNVTPTGGESIGEPAVLSVPCTAAISDDGSVVTFPAGAGDLVAGDTNGLRDQFVRGVDNGTDITGDGDLDDTVLDVLDTTAPSPALAPLCPADAVSAVTGAAAFLRPESAGATPNLASCPTGAGVTGGVDLNGDGDANDDVVHLVSSAGTVQNLGVAATAVSLSGTCVAGTNPGQACSTDANCPGSTCNPAWIGALVPPTDGATGVLQVHRVSDPPATWTNVGQAGDTLQMAGTLGVFITPEAAQNKDLNGDGKKIDRVIQVYDAAAANLTNLGQAAEEFVVGDRPVSCGASPLIAFRTSEAAQGNRDLNDDGDTSDFVLQVYAQGLGVINTHQAVHVCDLAACDPRLPYRVTGNQAKFLTLESDQGRDLNGNNTTSDLVLQIFDVCTRKVTVAATVDATATNANPLTDAGAATSTETPATASAVVTTGQRCMTTLSSPASCTTGSDCPSGAQCIANVCKTVQPVPASCTADADCTAPATCQLDQVVAAPAVSITHDTVVLARPAVNARIPKGQNQVTVQFPMRVRNADILPKREKPGHTVRLTASDGTCPVGTVAGLPDFDNNTAGAQDSVLLPGGRTKAAMVTLTVNASAFANIHNSQAPRRCTLQMQADSVLAGNVDPTPRNNIVGVELNVLDANDPPSSAVHESVIKSVSPLTLSLSRTNSTASATKRVRLLNADIGESAGHDITLTANDGDCPAGTVTVLAPSTQTVPGGTSVRATVQVNVTNSGFTSPNGRSPGRCTAVLSATTAVGGNSEPDPSNNSTALVINVVDRHDF